MFAYLYLSWTMSLTRKSSRKMNKDVLAGMVLDYKERFDSSLSSINDELKELKTEFRKLESDLAISWNVSDKLTKQLILVKRKCWTNEQYSRWECLYISGIPDSIRIMTCKTALWEFSMSVTPQWTRQILKLATD